MRDEIKKYVVAQLQKKYTLKDIDDLDKFDYVESGYIDSIGLLQFLADIEEHFDFEFEDEELSGEAVHTVGGLVDLICTKKQ